VTARIFALALLGACIGTGLALLAATALTSAESSSPPPRHEDRPPGPEPVSGRRAVSMRRLAVPGVAGLTGYVLTGWPMLAVLAGCGTYFLPGLLRGESGQGARLARIDAVASWAELLRDTLSASAGLYEAIRATAPLAPAAIRPATTHLAERLARAGTNPHSALRAFADEVADSVADRVAIALGFAVANPTRDLAGLLGALARAAREQAAMGARIQAARARTRTAVRMITGVTLGMGTVLGLLDRNFLAPYGSAFGQLALAVIGGLFAGGFTWLSRLSQLPEPPRLLTPAPVPAQRNTPADTGTMLATAESK